MKEQIFKCEDIRWKEVEGLFAEIKEEKPPVKLSEGLLPPELAVIADHVVGCDDCRETLVGLAKRYDITEGTIFPQESEKKSTQ